MEPVVQLQRVTCRYPLGGGEVVALDDVTLDVAPGSFVAVMGATGSGKSTLLHCAAGLEPATAGELRLLGHDVAHLGERALSRLRRDHVGLVFQSYNLLSDLTIAQNVLLPRRLGARTARPLGDLLAEVGLSGSADQPVGELSGGQRQRVAVARALATDPAVVFADEPTGALDPNTGAHVLALLRRAVDTRGGSVVMVTHDPNAAAVSDRLVLLRSGQVVDDRRTPGADAIAALLSAAVPTPAVVGAREARR